MVVILTLGVSNLKSSFASNLLVKVNDPGQYGMDRDIVLLTSLKFDKRRTVPAYVGWYFEPFFRHS